MRMPRLCLLIAWLMHRLVLPQQMLWLACYVQGWVFAELSRSQEMSAHVLTKVCMAVQDAERQTQLSEAAAAARNEVQMLRNLLSNAC